MSGNYLGELSISVYVYVGDVTVNNVTVATTGVGYLTYNIVSTFFFSRDLSPLVSLNKSTSGDY